MGQPKFSKDLNLDAVQKKWWGGAVREVSTRLGDSTYS